MHAQRRCGGRRWSDSAGVCGQSGAEPAKPDGSTEIGPLSCAASPTSLHRQVGWQRALGIPSFEDKVAQRAIVMLLEPIYEHDFLDCSFGFRVGRNAHQALLVIRRGITEQRSRWVLEVDVRKYFDQPSQCPP